MADPRMEAGFLADIRTALVTVLQDVGGIGVVHGFERYANDLGKLKAHYLWTNPATNEPEIRGWFLRRLSTAEGEGQRVVGWRVQGYLSLEDGAASELEFDALIERIGEAFRDRETLIEHVFLNSANGDVDGLQVDESGPVIFAGVLCHGAQLRLVTRYDIDGWW